MIKQIACRAALLLAALLPFFCSSGQGLGVQLSWVEPAGTLGTVYKTAPAVDVLWAENERDARWHMSLSLGYYAFQPQRDTFSSYAIGSGGNGTTVVPAYEVYGKYQVLSAASFVDYRIFDKRISPLVGLGMGLYGSYHYYHNKVETVVDYEGGEAIWTAALVPRVGVSCRVGDRWEANALVARSLGLQTDYVTRAFMKSSLNFNYFFD
jgi:hypothetical protein